MTLKSRLTFQLIQQRTMTKAMISGTAYVLPKFHIKQLEKIFRSRILAILIVSEYIP